MSLRKHDRGFPRLNARIAFTVVALAILSAFGSHPSTAFARPAGHVTASTSQAQTAATPHLTPTATPTAVLRATSTPQPRVVVPADTTARQRRVFRSLWNIVNERYVYPDFNGLNWRAVRTEMNRRIAAGMTDEAFYAAMHELIIRLNDNHSDFRTPDEAKAENDEFDGVGTYIGIGIVSAVNQAKRHIYVLTVLPDSPAEWAGIRPHDHVLSINGQPAVNERGESQAHLMRGEEGTPVTLQVRTPGQAPRTLELSPARVTSVERIVYHLLADGTGDKRTGYINIPSLFEHNVLARARDAMRELMREGDLDGLILDLRTNGGGTYGNLRGLLSLFTYGEAGQLVTRNRVASPIRVRADGIGNSQRVPLAVLIGPSTESFAEVLAGALQAKGRARLIGQNTAGNIETLLSHEFEDGSRLWLAEETFRLPDGSSWEGVGLTPDIRVEKNWDEYTAEDDPVLAEALRYFGIEE